MIMGYFPCLHVHSKQICRQYHTFSPIYYTDQHRRFISAFCTSFCGLPRAIVQIDIMWKIRAGVSRVVRQFCPLVIQVLAAALRE